eukprot:TRINITY_DN2_c0_g2_i1.p1 TRINITY_DN2_c0_g2~~TRINITY_DN2_c0_g2_i1.p1  ORF type:complete len:437 (-),score=195.07 TRINITY_DN2_c0_g2_i1:95-1405(-)
MNYFKNYSFLFLVFSLISLIICQNSITPQQIHIAFAGETGMTISWLTEEKTATSIVQYGLQSGLYTANATGYFTQYYKSYHHNAVLPNLKPLTKYYYICGDATTKTWSTENYFISAPLATTHIPFTVAVYGDMGTTNSEDTIRTLKDEVNQADWHYHVGDISYADDHAQFTYEDIWNQYQTLIEPFTSVRPYMTCPGNHEATCHSIGTFGCKDEFRNFSAYQNRFRMPSSESGSPSGNMWFSFNYSTVHFVSISSETDFPNSPEGPRTIFNAGPFGDQITWLKEDLKKANQNRNNQPWIIVVGHRPMYSSGSTDFPPNVREDLRTAIEDILHENKVDLYICGHVHSYERLYPIYNNVVVQKNYDSPQAVVPIVIGNAGNIEGHTVEFVSPDPDYLAFRNSEDYGFALMTVYNETTIRWAALRATDGSIFDEIYIRK